MSFQAILAGKGQNEIEAESEAVEKLVLSARNGKWDTVWSILGTPENPKKSYLLNAIPQHRRWGVLHQAAYWKNPTVLRTLLKFRSCDAALKAKECTSECGRTDSMTAEEIAEQYKYMQMKKILSQHIQNNVFEMEIPTYQPYEGYCDNKGLCLVSLTLASYKKAFHPRPITHEKPIMAVLVDIFNDLKSSDSRWKKVQAVVADSVFPVSQAKANMIRSCTTKDMFFHQVVNSYTDENNSIYAYLNVAFRRQREQNYCPTGDDLAMGPYCVMYQILLLFWDDLSRESNTTFRKMKLTTSDIKKYSVGKRFVWQSVVSSAREKGHTHMFPTRGPLGEQEVLFTIDNSDDSIWQPRNIEHHAAYNETERTYPAGARFQVRGVKKESGQVQIALKLLAR